MGPPQQPPPADLCIGLDATVVKQCVADIEAADFVALDLEFSGLFLSTEREKRMLSVEELFQKGVQSIPEFLPIQLGVCCGRQLQECKWELRTHEFNMWPSERRVFTADLQSLRFLRLHGFDFNEFFERAHPYHRLPSRGLSATVVAHTMRMLPPAHLGQVMAALRDSQVPLVFHNGFLDLLHLYDKFIDVLPKEVAGFGEAWASHFPLIFDTRVMAQEGKFQVLRHQGGINLEELHRHLVTMAGMAIYGHNVTFERAGSLGANRSAHSAGQDALHTAEVFVMQMDLWVRADARGITNFDGVGQGRKKRRKGGGLPDLPPAPAAPAAGQTSLKAFVAAAPAPQPAVPGPEAPAAAGVDAGADGASAATASSGAGAAAPAGAEAAEEGGAEDGGEWTVVGRKRPRGAPAAAAPPAAAGGAGGAGSGAGGAAAPEGAPAASGGTGFHSPALLQTLEICRKFHNRVAIVGAMPGHIRLAPPLATVPTAGVAFGPVPPPAAAPQQPREGAAASTAAPAAVAPAQPAVPVAELGAEFKEAWNVDGDEPRGEGTPATAAVPGESAAAAAASTAPDGDDPKTVAAAADAAPAAAPPAAVGAPPEDADVVTISS